jgi:LmbE family N-acetylglucosaminyl deacetylase
MTVPWLIISPDFDDAVLSCGDLIAAHPGSVVLTVSSGVPPSGVIASDWGRAGGFSTAEEAGLGRREEDLKALRALGASQATTQILDSPYRSGAEEHGAAVQWIETAIDEIGPERIAIPLGTEDHEDHVMTRVASITAMTSRRFSDAYLYADLPYFFGSDCDAVAGGPVSTSRITTAVTTG